MNYYGDVNTVVVCDENRRKQLIEQRQRLLEEQSKGTVIKINGHQADSEAAGREVGAVITALPAQQTQPDANVGAGNGIAAQQQGPAPKQDPLSQWRDSIRTAATWKTTEPENHAGMFGPYPEELE